jgi:hypothetical protein
MDRVPIQFLQAGCSFPPALPGASYLRVKAMKMPDFQRMNGPDLANQVVAIAVKCNRTHKKLRARRNPDEGNFPRIRKVGHGFSLGVRQLAAAFQSQYWSSTKRRQQPHSKETLNL